MRKLCVTERKLKAGVMESGIDQAYDFQPPYLKSLSQIRINARLQPTYTFKNTHF